MHENNHPSTIQLLPAMAGGGIVMLVKTSDLIGPALDWAVAKALGWSMVRVPADIDGNNGGEVLAPPDFSKDFKFPPRGAIGVAYFLRHWSTDWSHGGPLIEKHAWALPQRATHRYHLGAFEAYTPGGFPHNGPTPLVAACRAIVAAELGDQVDVPDELMQS